PDPLVHDQRAPPGVHHGVRPVPAVLGDRPRRLRVAHLDGHDGPPPVPDLPSVQDPALRPRGRMASGDRFPRAELLLMDGGDLSLAVDLGREALWVAVKLSFPILVSALIVGGMISVLQAATQLQDPTLNQVPKMFAVAAMVFLMLPWVLAVLAEYTHELVKDMGMYFR